MLAKLLCRSMMRVVIFMQGGKLPLPAIYPGDEFVYDDGKFSWLVYERQPDI